MTGWKTNASGIGMMVWAVLGFYFKLIDANQAMEQFLAGFGLIGIGHKIDKGNGNAN
jgi:hypothetical protein